MKRNVELMAEEDKKVLIQAALTGKAHRKLGILCAAYNQTIAEFLSEWLEKWDLDDAVERLR